MLMVSLSVLNDVPEYIPTKRIIFSTNLKTEATGQRLGIPVYNSRALKARGVMPAISDFDNPPPPNRLDASGGSGSHGRFAIGDCRFKFAPPRVWSMSRK